MLVIQLILTDFSTSFLFCARGNDGTYAALP